MDCLTQPLLPAALLECCWWTQARKMGPGWRRGGKASTTVRYRDSNKGEAEVSPLLAAPAPRGLIMATCHHITELAGSTWVGS